MMDRLKFDDVVVGGGAAGRVLANRSRPADDGALIEAGMDTPPDATRSEILDSYAMPLFFGDKYIWSGLFEPPKDVYEQGRVMKGGSRSTCSPATEACLAIMVNGATWASTVGVGKMFSRISGCSIIV